VEEGFPQREIAESAYQWQRDVEKGERVQVGVNRFQDGASDPNIPLLKIEEEVAHAQVAKLKALKARRDADTVAKSLARVEAACRSGEDVMPPLIDAVKAYATLGEIADVYRRVWGAYRETASF